MPFSDPIADLLTKIRNALGAKHRYVDIPLSKMKVQVLKVLKDKGFIENFLVSDKSRKMRVFLKYTPKRQPVIRGLKRVSTPGLRIYVSLDEIPYVRKKMGISILSTTNGILDDQAARELKIGGELLCQVW